MSKDKQQEASGLGRVVVAFLLIGFTIIAKVCPDPRFKPLPRMSRCTRCWRKKHDECLAGKWTYEGKAYCRCCGNPWK